MSAESQMLRGLIRSGTIAAEKGRPLWQVSVQQIYDIERAEERNQYQQFETCMLGKITDAFGIRPAFISAGPRL